MILVYVSPLGMDAGIMFSILQVHEFWAKRTPEISWRHTSREVRACIEIALKCVKSDRVMRPTMTEILDKLNNIYIADCSSINQLYGIRESTLEFLERITNESFMMVGRYFWYLLVPP